MTTPTLQITSNQYNSLALAGVALPSPGGFTTRPIEDEYSQIFKIVKGTRSPSETEYSIKVYVDEDEIRRLKNLETIEKDVGISGFDTVRIEPTPTFADQIKNQS